MFSVQRHMQCKSADEQPPCCMKARGGTGREHLLFRERGTSAYSSENGVQVSALQRTGHERLLFRLAPTVQLDSGIFWATGWSSDCSTSCRPGAWQCFHEDHSPTAYAQGMGTSAYDFDLHSLQITGHECLSTLSLFGFFNCPASAAQIE